MPKIGVNPGVTEELLALAARTSSGDSGVLNGWGTASILRCQLVVTAVSGVTPTLNVVIEDTLDGVRWNVIGSFPQRAGIGHNVIDITSPFADRIRIRHTIGGTTPSFTFAVIIYSE